MFIIFFGLGFIGLVILFLSACYSRSRLAFLLGGAVAAILMVLQCLLLNFAAGVDSATSGRQGGYSLFGGAILVFIVSLVIYFFVALARIIDKQ